MLASWPMPRTSCRKRARWQGADPAASSARRLAHDRYYPPALDRLRSASAGGSSLGPWLPEPISSSRVRRTPPTWADSLTLGSLSSSHKLQPVEAPFCSPMCSGPVGGGRCRPGKSEVAMPVVVEAGPANVMSGSARPQADRGSARSSRELVRRDPERATSRPRSRDWHRCSCSWADGGADRKAARRPPSRLGEGGTAAYLTSPDS